MVKIRILLADDHTLMRAGLRLLLEAEPDLEVIGEAKDGQEAVTRAGELCPDVVLMDLAMPLLDGLEATRRIVAAEPQTRVLILTMYSNEEYLWPVLEAGAAGYMLKNSAAAELCSAVRAVVRGEAFISPHLTRRLIADYTKGGRTKAPLDAEGRD